MFQSFWRPILLEGGLSVITRAAGAESPVVFRTTIQIDSDIVTLVDLTAGGDNPRTLASHWDAVRQACRPLLETARWIDRAATGSAFLFFGAVAWGAFFQQSPQQRTMASAIAGALVLLLRWVFPRPFLWAVRCAGVRLLRIYIRFFLKRFAPGPAGVQPPVSRA